MKKRVLLMVLTATMLAGQCSTVAFARENATANVEAQANGQTSTAEVDLAARRIVGISMDGSFCDYSLMGTGSCPSYAAIDGFQSVVGDANSYATDSMGNMYVSTLLRPGKSEIIKLSYNTDIMGYEIATILDVPFDCSDIALDEAANKLYIVANTGEIYTVDFENKSLSGITKLSVASSITVDDNHNLIIAGSDGRLYAYTSAGTMLCLGASNTRGIYDIMYDDHMYFILEHGTDNQGNASNTVNVYDDTFRKVGAFEIESDKYSLALLPEVLFESENIVATCNVGSPATNVNASPNIDAYKIDLLNGQSSQEQNDQQVQVDDTKIVTNYGTWISGSYISGSARYTEDATRICLSEPIVATSSERYVFTLKDPNLEVIVRMTTPGYANQYTTLNGRNGSYLQTMPGYTYYIIIKSKNSSQTFDDYRAAMAQDPEYINITRK